MPEERKRNIFGTPYDLKESFNWWVKHAIIDIYYPFIALIFLIFIFQILPFYLFVILVMSLHGFIIIFLSREYQRLSNKIENIGKKYSKHNNNSRWYQLNKIENAEYNIGFLGDIMRMGKYKLEFSQELIDFFKPVSLIVGNLEGILTKKRKRYFTDQKHSEETLRDMKEMLKQEIKSLKEVKPAKNWLLNVSNNHSADFGQQEFSKSLDIIKSEDFKVFGTIENPVFLYPPPNGPICFIAGTMWSNKKNYSYVANFDNIETYQNNNGGEFNILFPHWHYENESYVRKNLQVKVKNLIKNGKYISRIKDAWMNKKFLKFFFNDRVPRGNYDLIFGHHPHVPQPITQISHNGVNKLIAFSGGNFTSSKWRKKHISGLICKCEVGKIIDDVRWGVGKMEWSYTINVKHKSKRIVNGKEKKVKIDTVVLDKMRNKANAFVIRKTKLFTNLIVSGCIGGAMYLLIAKLYWNFDLLSLLVYALLVLIIILGYLLLRKQLSVKKQ